MIAGILITLSADTRIAESALQAIRNHPNFETGVLQKRWLPAVFETSAERDRRSLNDWLEALPGVEFVDVVFVNFENQVSNTDLCL